MRLREQGIHYLIEKITLNFNKRAEYKDKFYTFDNILLDNVRKLGNSIEKDQKELKFEIPNIEISRNDNVELRNKIMSITPELRKKLKINKSTLWYQQKAIKEYKVSGIVKRSYADKKQVPTTKLNRGFRIFVSGQTMSIIPQER